jgi:hypothetical protein
MRWVFVAGLLAMGVASVRAQPAPRPAPPGVAPSPKVAIVVEVAVGVEPGRASEIASALARALNAQLEVDARGGAAVETRLGSLADGCLAQPACVTDVARRLEVEQLLFIALVQLGDQLQIDASWMDASGAQAASRPRIQLGPGDVADEVFRGRAVTLLPEARLRRTPDVLPPPPPPVPSARGRHMSAATWTVAGIGAVGLGAGAVLGLSTRSKFIACERDGCDADARDSLRTRGLLADVAVGVGAAAAITATVLYLRSARRAPGVAIDVDASGSGASLTIGGRF